MSNRWPQGGVAAISLTFDGATRAHLEACAKLGGLELRATVYADPANLLADPRGWRRSHDVGHELGAHPFFALADSDGLIARLPSEAVEGEVDDCRRLLVDEFGASEHSVALPLVRTLPDESGMPAVPEIVHRTIVRMNEEAVGSSLRARYDVVRTPLGRFNESGTDLRNLRCCRVDDLDAVTIGLIAQVAISKGDWAILSWGPDPNMETVAQVSRWLHRQPIWVAPVIEVARHLRETSPSSPTFQPL